MLSVATAAFSQSGGSSLQPNAQGAAAALFSTWSQFQERLQTVANTVTGSSAFGPAARTLDAICGGSVASGLTTSSEGFSEIDSQYLYFDPKTGNKPIAPSASRFRGPFQKCIVFIVGGGCYQEYHNLRSYSQQKKREIIYGATEMLSPSEFLRQLRESA